MADDIHYSEKLGRYAAYFADVPGWHNKGIVEKGLKSWKEVAELTDLAYEMEVRQLEWNGNLIEAYGTFRADTDHFFHTCGKNYGCITPTDSFLFVDSVLDAIDGSHYDAAGQLGNGSVFWTLAKIPEDFKIGDDCHKTYLGFVSSHDGSFAATAKLTDIRWVCRNTIQMGLRSEGKVVKIKHTRNAKERLEQARKILKGTTETVKTLHDRLEFLANHKMTKEGFEEIANRLFPIDENVKFQTKRDNLLVEILNLYENNDSNAFPEFKGTSYNLFNAIVEHTDHFRNVRLTENRKYLGEDGARAESALFGAGATLKNDAMDVIYEVAQNLPHVPYKTFTQRAIGSGEYEKPTEQGNGLLDSILDEHHNN